MEIKCSLHKHCGLILYKYTRNSGHEQKRLQVLNDVPKDCLSLACFSLDL